jgi:DNA primase
MRELKYSEETLKKCGLFIENSKGELFDRFRGRIMFPIFDIRGSVIAFGGRVLDESLPKYMNSPETPVYIKGRNLYALNFVRKIGDKRIIIVEGYMDVISLHQSGIINAVASLGTALTEEQGRLLRMYGEEVIISYDSDVAGQNATQKGLDILDELGCSVKVLKVPDGKDPDDYIKSHGADSFMKLIGKSLTLLEYKVTILKEQTDTTSTAGKIDFLNKTAEVLSKIDNNIEREMYIKKLSKDYDVREDSLESEISKKKNIITKKTKGNVVENRNTNSNINTKSVDVLKSKNFEKILIALLTVDNSIFKVVEGELSSELFKGEIEKKLIEIVSDKIRSGKGITVPELLGNLEDDIRGEYVRVIDKESVFEDNLKAFRDIQKKLEVERLNQRKQEILNLLKRNDIKDETYLDELKKELSNILLNQKKL